MIAKYVHFHTKEKTHVPAPEQMANGEIAVCYAKDNERLFMKDSENAITEPMAYKRQFDWEVVGV